MIEVEVFGAPARRRRAARPMSCGACARRPRSARRRATVTSRSSSSTRAASRELNGEHRGKPEPTDVLSFPIDGVAADGGAPEQPAGAAPVELGDVVICPEHTVDLREAIVHGMLHLLGMDHEPTTARCWRCRPSCSRGRADERAAASSRSPGGPNVGKSTLVNAVVGEKVAIVSDRPQTTRRAIRGVHQSGDCQIVLVDLPGVQRPRDELTARMARRVQQELEGADAALLMLNGEQGVGPGDRFIARGARDAPACPVAIAVNKVDGSRAPALVEALEQAAALELDGEVFPISARSGTGVEQLVEHLAALMPEGPFMFAAGASSDQDRELLLAELIREAVIRRTFQEVPHAVEVVVEEIEAVRADLTRVRALIWVETQSQKGILVGAQGRMIKAIGTAATTRARARARDAACTSTCPCASAATGAPTTACSTGSASPEAPRRRAARRTRWRPRRAGSAVELGRYLDERRALVEVDGHDRAVGVAVALAAIDAPAQETFAADRRVQLRAGGNGGIQ